MSKTLHLAQSARTRLATIDGLSVFELDSQDMTLDPTRLTVNVTQLGLSGFEADEILHQQLGVTAELPTLSNLTFVITWGNTPADIDQLVLAFTILATDYRKPSLSFSTPSLPDSPTLVVSPREAFWSTKETLPLEKTLNRVSGELVCPYPPGIPVLIPGEVISSATLAYLEQVVAQGSLITIKGCSDSTLKTLKVL